MSVVGQKEAHGKISSFHLANVSIGILKSRRIAVIDNGTVLGAGLADVFTHQVTQDGGLVMLRNTVNNKTGDFNAVLSRVKREVRICCSSPAWGPRRSPSLSAYSMFSSDAVGMLAEAPRKK
jgi:hypothetical protein